MVQYEKLDWNWKCSISANGERFTLGLRSVASWEGQTGVKAYVMLSVLNFFVRGFLN